MQKMMWEENYPMLLDLIERGFDLETEFKLWCHSSHGDQTHTLLSYCGELEGMHAGTKYGVPSEFHPLAGCQWVINLLELGARVDTVGVAAALYHCGKCLRRVLEEGANVDGTIQFDSYSGTTLRSGIERSRGGCFDSVSILIEFGAAYVPISNDKNYQTHGVKMDEFFAFELPLRQDNCRAAILTFLGAIRHYFAHFIDRNIALRIAKSVWSSRRDQVWSFHEHMLLTETWDNFF